MHDLAVLFGYSEPSAVREWGRQEVLAFDLPAMQACRAAGIPFLTPGDLFSAAQFRTSFGDALVNVETVFEAIDKKYADEIGFPHAFKSNIYHFLCYLAELHYMKGLARALKHRYSTPLILTSRTEDIDDEARIAMTAGGFGYRVFMKHDAPLYNMRHFARALGMPAIKRLPAPADHRSRLRLRVPRHAYLLRPANFDLLYEKLASKVAPIFHANRGQNVVWCVQDGFEVARLKRYIRNCRFVDPMRDLGPIPGGISREGVRLKYRELLDTLVQLYPEWQAELTGLLDAYHRDVVARMPALTEQIAAQIERHGPCCALFSIGAGVPVEGLYAWMLNERRIPIFTFQHGGSDNLYFSTPLNKYYEFSPYVEQTTICVSKAEVDARRRKYGDMSTVAAGGIRMFEWKTSRRRRRERSGNGRLLYVQGRYPSEMWKNLFCVEDESQIFAKHEQFFEKVSKYRLAVDIKLYPGTAKLYGPYFRRFAHRHGVEDFRLVADMPAEVTAPAYDVVVVEYIASALNGFCMLLDKPVIYYLFDDLVKADIADDFYRRHYVAHHGDALDALLGQYREGRLASKYSWACVDKYVYPVDGVNPGARIAEFMKSSVARWRDGVQ